MVVWMTDRRRERSVQWIKVRVRSVGRQRRSLNRGAGLTFRRNLITGEAEVRLTTAVLTHGWTKYAERQTDRQTDRGRRGVWQRRCRGRGRSVGRAAPPRWKRGWLLSTTDGRTSERARALCTQLAAGSKMIIWHAVSERQHRRTNSAS